MRYNQTSEFCLVAKKEVLGKEKCPESPNWQVALPANESRGAPVRRFSPGLRKPLVPPPWNLARSAPRTARYLGARWRARIREHTPVAGAESWKVAQRGGAQFPSFPLERNKRTKTFKGSGRNPWRGAPPSRTPQLPPAEAVPSRARRVTSRDRRAGGCHGDTWASLHCDPPVPIAGPEAPGDHQT